MIRGQHDAFELIRGLRYLLPVLNGGGQHRGRGHAEAAARRPHSGYMNVRGKQGRKEGQVSGLHAEQDAAHLTLQHSSRSCRRLLLVLPSSNSVPKLCLVPSGKSTSPPRYRLQVRLLCVRTAACQAVDCRCVPNWTHVYSSCRACAWACQ